MKGHGTMFRYDSDYTPPNTDYTHDSEREHQLDTLATEVSKDQGIDYVAARAWARANLDSLLAFAAWWDQKAEDVECEER
jgi:hypothetical protein